MSEALLAEVVLVKPPVVTELGAWPIPDVPVVVQLAHGIDTRPTLGVALDTNVCRLKRIETGGIHDVPVGRFRKVSFTRAMASFTPDIPLGRHLGLDVVVDGVTPVTERSSRALHLVVRVEIRPPVGARLRMIPSRGDEPRCFVLCAPEVKIEPTLTFEPIFRRPSVEALEDGEVVETGQPETETVFELVLAVGIPTQIPRIGLTVETIFIPSGEASANPFTGATAGELGRSSLRGNEIEVELELNLGVLEPEQTGGWVESHFDVVDKISAAKRPRDTSAYTHKLNFEWDTSFLAFKWLPEGNWLRHVELEGSLDYVATGLPRRGDVIDGRERFLDDDSPWSFSLVVVFPLAPLVP